MDEQERAEALRRVARKIALMPALDQVGRGEWVQLPDGQWVRAQRAGHDLVDRQVGAGEESQVDPDDDGEHIA